MVPKIGTVGPHLPLANIPNIVVFRLSVDFTPYAAVSVGYIAIHLDVDGLVPKRDGIIYYGTYYEK